MKAQAQKESNIRFHGENNKTFVYWNPDKTIIGYFFNKVNEDGDSDIVLMLSSKFKESFDSTEDQINKMVETLGAFMSPEDALAFKSTNKVSTSESPFFLLGSFMELADVVQWLIKSESIFKKHILQ